MGVEGGFAGLDGLVEGGDFGVEGEDAVAQGGFGSGAEGEEVADEAGGIEGFGDVEVAEGVPPLGGEEGGVGAVVEPDGFATGDVEGEFVVGVGDGEGGTGLEQGVEGVELVLEDGGVLFLGPGGEFAGAEASGGGEGGFPGGGGANLRPQPVFPGRGGDGRGLRAGKAVVELGDGVAAERVEVLQLAGAGGDIGALLGAGVGDGERGDELFVGFVIAAFFGTCDPLENPVGNRAVDDPEQEPSCDFIGNENPPYADVVETELTT